MSMAANWPFPTCPGSDAVEQWLPTSEDELAAMIAGAFAARTRLAVAGQGTLDAVGRTAAADAALSTRLLAGIVDYQPDELMITLGPGTPLAEVEAALAARGQMLAFEPVPLGLIHGRAGATIGGVLGANLSGPRRFRAGAARDHVLAVRAVGGRGECFKAGGKVVKNVTGYDLHKLLTGAWGTLAVIAEATVKVMPLPPHRVTVAASAGDIAAGLAQLRALAADPREPTGLALVGHGIGGVAGPALAIRFEGSRAAAQACADDLVAQLADARLVSGGDSDALWRDIGLGCAAGGDDGPETNAGPLWRLSVPPGDAARILVDAAPHAFVADHAGGLLWLDRPRPGWAVPRGDIAAMLIRGRGDGDGDLPTTGYADPGIVALSQRLKREFDPAGILNPGRIYAQTGG